LGEGDFLPGERARMKAAPRRCANRRGWPAFAARGAARATALSPKAIPGQHSPSRWSSI